MRKKISGMLLFLCAACVLALPLFAAACDRTLFRKGEEITRSRHMR